MPIDIGPRLKRAWNAFRNKDPTYDHHGPGSYYRPDQRRVRIVQNRTIVTAIYNRIAMDVASIDVRHVRLDDDGRFIEEMESGLNGCLSLEANLDQTGRAFFQDVVLSMLDEGCVAIVPVDTDHDPRSGMPGSFDVLSMRTAKVVAWYPSYVRLRLYNERTGRHEEITLPKRAVCIIQNPLYAVMNEPNGTMQRLIRKLDLLDVVDEQTSSGKLDLIFQLPYTVRTERRREQASIRRKDIEDQLTGSKYGIAYIDATERVTQLNRPIENNLMSQVEYLTTLLYSQLGLTQGVLDGSADDRTMTNYYDRTIEPILSAIVDEMKRKFLTKTARSQRQSVLFFRDPFKLVPVSEIAEIADKMTRNEIMTGNEIRQVIGLRPSDDPGADELRNKNLNQQTDQRASEEGPAEAPEEEGW